MKRTARKDEIDETVSDFIVRVLSDDPDSIDAAIVVIARETGLVETHLLRGLWDWEVRGLLSTAMPSIPPSEDS
jgi:hypothetical protein